MATLLLLALYFQKLYICICRWGKTFFFILRKPIKQKLLSPFLLTFATNHNAMNNNAMYCNGFLCILISSFLFISTPARSASSLYAIEEDSLEIIIDMNYLDYYDIFPYCSYDNIDCTSDVLLEFNISTNCPLDSSIIVTGSVDIDGDGTGDSPVEIEQTSTHYEASTTLPIGDTYTLYLTATDGCGGSALASFPFVVVDCKAPSPICTSGLEVELMSSITGNGIMVIYVFDYIASDIQDCSGIKGYSIHKGVDVINGTDVPSYPHPSITLTCEDGPTTIVRIYAWDNANNPYAVQPDGSIGGPNYDYCESFVIVQDWAEACSPDSLYLNIPNSTPDLFCAYDNESCLGSVNIPFYANSNCQIDSISISAGIDMDEDLIADTIVSLPGNAPPYYININLPIGSYHLLLSAENGCGTVKELIYEFAVADCVVSEPECGAPIDTLLASILAAEGVYTLPEELVTIDSNDCSGIRGISIFKSKDITSGHVTAYFPHPSIQLSCDDGDSIPIRIYVWDFAENPASVNGNNSSYCESYILLSDWEEICTRYFITGQITTETGEKMEGIPVFFNGTYSDTVQTNVVGIYASADILNGNQFSWHPYLNERPNNGLTVTDLIILRRHLLGIELLDSPYKRIAADANNSGTITIADLVEIQKSILGQGNGFTNNTSWRFIDASFIFQETAPYEIEEFPEIFSIDSLSGDQIGANFIGVKIGDLNNSAAQ